MPPEVTSRRLVQRKTSESRMRSPRGSSDETLVTSLRLHVICVVLTLLSAYIFTLTEHDDDRHDGHDRDVHWVGVYGLYEDRFFSLSCQCFTIQATALPLLLKRTEQIILTMACLSDQIMPDLNGMSD